MCRAISVLTHQELNTVCTMKWFWCSSVTMGPALASVAVA
jgi:hypothetical protein